MFNIHQVELYEWDYLYYFEHEIDIAVEAFKAIDSGNQNILEQIKDIHKSVLEKDSYYIGLDDESKASYHSAMYESKEIVIREIQIQQSYSIVLSIFSFFEGRLKSICEEVESHFQIKLKRKKSKQDDLSHFYNYLVSHFKIKNQNLDEIFSKIKIHKFIRNKIAHSEGYLLKKDLKKIPFDNGISIGLRFGSRIVEVDHAVYLPILLQLMNNFFVLIIREVNKGTKDLKVVE